MQKSSQGTQASPDLRCPTSGEVMAGDDLTLRCVTPADFHPAKVTLYYKRIGSEEFQAVLMDHRDTPSGRSTWTARIPGTHVAGRRWPFYFEATDGDGQMLASSGRYESPNIIAVAGDAYASGAARPTSAVSGDSENPLAARAKAQQSATEAKPAWFFGLGFGSGLGYAASDAEQPTKSQSSGVAFQGLGHAVVEIGRNLSDSFALSVQGRMQYFPRPNPKAHNSAFAAFARAHFFAAAGDSGQFFANVAVGGGQGVRMIVQETTVRAGPVLLGAGAGYAHALNSAWALVFESNLLAGVPDFSLVLDFNAGLRTTF